MSEPKKNKDAPNPLHDISSEEEELFRKAMQELAIIPQEEDHKVPLPAAPKISLQVKESKQPITHKDEEAETSEIGPLTSLFHTQKRVPQKITRKIKAGKLPLCGTIDLHGLTWQEARAELDDVISHLAGSTERCLLVIHGKAHGTVLGKATLKTMVYRYLKSHPRVLVISSAHPKDGGLGAVYVLLE